MKLDKIPTFHWSESNDDIKKKSRRESCRKDSLILVSHWTSGVLYGRGMSLWLSIYFLPSLSFLFQRQLCVIYIWNWIYARLTIGQTHCGLFSLSVSLYLIHPSRGFFVPLLGSAHPSRHFFFKQKGTRWRERGVIWYYKFLTGIYIYGCESKVRPPSLFNSTLSNIVSQSLIFLTLLHTGWWTLCETLLHQILNGLN